MLPGKFLAFVDTFLQATAALESSREALTRQQAALTAADFEQRRSSKELEDLRSRANTVEEVSYPLVYVYVGLYGLCVHIL